MSGNQLKGFDIWRLLSVVTLSAMVVACAGDGDTSSAESPRADVQQTADVQVTVSDYAFAPDEVTVPAGAEVTITVTNATGLAHNWVLLSEGPMVTDEDALDEDGVFVDLLAVVDDRVVANVLTGPETDQQVTFLAPPAGTYQVICTVARHLGFGMEGTLVVDA